MAPCGEPLKPLPTTQCAQAQPGRCQSYLLTIPKYRKGLRFKAVTDAELGQQMPSCEATGPIAMLCVCVLVDSLTCAPLASFIGCPSAPVFGAS